MKSYDSGFERGFSLNLLMAFLTNASIVSPGSWSAKP